MRIILIAMFYLLATVAGVQAQAPKEPVTVLYHGNIYTFNTPVGEVTVTVWLPRGACRFGVTATGQHRQVFLREERTSLLVGTPSPEVRCGDMVQLHLLTNTMPEGWEFKGGKPIS